MLLCYEDTVYSNHAGGQTINRRTAVSYLMILYRFITDWWIENATPDGIDDLLIEGLDSDSMNRMVQGFHKATGRYDFKEFKKYLADKGVKIIDVEQVEVSFTDKG